MTTRLRYLPLPEAVEGMVLGAPLMVAEHGVISFSLPAGHVLTDSNIHQMHIRRAEFVCVEEEDMRSEEERTMEWEWAETRLRHIFRAANLEDPAMARLYEAVLTFRKA